ncbi:hypothetical protein [Actomonas aquatica]|uniref:DUF3570 domain-containing protein n=1 Tax=Actomonas aquatica TaxID=2866162 RepID=A0ABZ1CB08_9BACT|nr:hypothetical protein [Opitutus sp. WL0086]WRQ88731.1 hypothetical protein K1X11_004895 [Opitutus sp. WL0086]
MALVGSAAIAHARPSLPTAAEIAAVVEKTGQAAETEPVLAEADSAEPDAAEDGGYAKTDRRRPFLRAYEPLSVGYTFQEDEHFLDFTLSVMVPLLHGYYPDLETPPTGETEMPAGSKLRPYFAFTGRAGQYINTRNSQPVVGKRFNPLISARYWWWNQGASPEARADTFVELVYAHESNGQWISGEAPFRASLGLHYLDELHRLEEERGPLNDALRARALRTAYESTRDEISRGWDYIGLNFSVRGGGILPNDNHRLQMKLSHYLSWGLLQQDAEEFAIWEDDAEGKPRDWVDGFELRYDGMMPLARWELFDGVEIDSEWALIYKTGIARPFRHHTFEAEAGLLINGFPLKFWYRYGYMNDLISYYRKESAGGLRFSFNRFSREELRRTED